MRKNRNLKGFTLIELLVVIAIIAILSVVVILTLNPTELLRQARDSNRISDMATLKSALSMYLADTASSTGLYGAGGVLDYSKCAIDIQGTKGTSCTTCACLGFNAAATSPPVSTTAALARGVIGTGWIPVNFSAISSGAPIGQEPVDPTDSNPNFYLYHASSGGSTFKITARMESLKYSSSGAADVCSTDGGTSSTLYEAGSDLSL